MTRIIFVAEPKTINSFELGIKYLVPDEWAHKIQDADSEGYLNIESATGDLSTALLFSRKSGRDCVAMIAFNTTRMDRVVFKGRSLEDWHAQDFVEELRHDLATDGVWDEGLIIGGINVWFKSRDKVSEILLDVTIARGERLLVDDAAIEAVLAVKELKLCPIDREV